MTHLIPADAPHLVDGFARARCGALVRAADHAAVPDCTACREADAADAQALEALRMMPPVHSEPVRHFNPTAGYVPRGQRRTR